MAGDSNVERRVGEHEVGALTAEQPVVALSDSGVSAQQPMSTEVPEIALARDGRALFFDQRRNIIGRIRGRLSAQNKIDFGGLKTRRRDVEVQIALDLQDLSQLYSEQLLVPRGG